MVTSSGPGDDPRHARSGTVYEIRVRGRLTPAQASVLAGMSVHVGDAETVFTGRVHDQSELQGLLDQMLASGMELVQVQRIPPLRAPGASSQEAGDDG